LVVFGLLLQGIDQYNETSPFYISSSFFWRCAFVLPLGQCVLKRLDVIGRDKTCMLAWCATFWRHRTHVGGDEQTIDGPPVLGTERSNWPPNRFSYSSCLVPLRASTREANPSMDKPTYYARRIVYNSLSSSPLTPIHHLYS
jgi:hypothetical protein